MLAPKDTNIYKYYFRFSTSDCRQVLFLEHLYWLKRFLPSSCLLLLVWTLPSTFPIKRAGLNCLSNSGHSDGDRSGSDHIWVSANSTGGMDDLQQDTSDQEGSTQVRRGIMFTASDAVTVTFPNFSGEQWYLLMHFCAVTIRDLDIYSRHGKWKKTSLQHVY